MNTKLTARNVKPGMIIRTATETRYEITEVMVKWGAVQVQSFSGWLGLDVDEMVTVIGHFNP